MPTDCPFQGYRCGTESSIYLSKDTVLDGDFIFPTNVGEEVDRLAHSAYFDGDCKKESFPIKIRKCDGFLLYYLQPTTRCPSAYCFGDKLPCPDGTSSETGFGPDCFGYPQDVKVVPSVVPNLAETEEKNIHGVTMVHSRVVFDCNLDSTDNTLTYTFSWYINDNLIPEATQPNLTVDDIVAGRHRLLQSAWEHKFRPNMLVKCGVRVRSPHFQAPTPITYSTSFFAGIKVEQTQDHHFYVDEDKSTNIPVTITMPLACSWNKNLNVNTTQENCKVNLLTGVPKYQHDEAECGKEVTQESIQFSPQLCGVYFSYLDWTKNRRRKDITIHGKPDGNLNAKDRFTVLKLYNADNVKPNEHLHVWKNIHLPDINIRVVDADKLTRGSACSSRNDPHMTTFDKRTYELQIRNGLTEGEYILYHHDRLPIQVHAYYKKCYVDVLCNCGVAVRSGDSLFVANFCKTKHTRSTYINRYIIQRLCGDNGLIVTESGNTYTIELPTRGTVTFSHGRVDSFYGIHSINVVPSILDKGHVKGLCGLYNQDPSDDLTPRNGNTPTNVKAFATSWKVTVQAEKLFTGSLSKPEYPLLEYCTCTIQNKDFPHGEPEYDCGWKSFNEACKDKTTNTAMVTQKCTEVNRKKRSITDVNIDEISDADEQPPIFEMEDEDEFPVNLPPDEWKNGLTEAIARKRCKEELEASPAFGPCSTNVPIDVTSFIENCVLDMKISGNDAWLKSTILNFGLACKQEAARTEVLVITNSTNSTGAEKSIFAIIEESTCPGNCSGHGHCIEGVCECIKEHYGDDCSLSKHTVPTLEKLAVEGLCDNRQRPCKKFIIPGYDFIQNNLTCKFHPFMIEQNETGSGPPDIVDEPSFVSEGTYRSTFYMLCELPPARRKRSVEHNVMATGYHISISNDGEKFTENVTMLVFDSLCAKCNVSTLLCEKLESCPQNIVVTRDDKTVLWIAVGTSTGVVSAIVVTVALLCLLKRLSLKKRKIGDSTTYLQDK